MESFSNKLSQITIHNYLIIIKFIYSSNHKQGIARLSGTENRTAKDFNKTANEQTLILHKRHKETLMYLVNYKR